MSSFCGVTSNKPAKDLKSNKKCACDYSMTFQDLEKDIETLYDELISLHPDFILKSEAVQEWQFQVYENCPQLKLPSDWIISIETNLKETELSIERITRDLDRIETILKSIEILTNKLKCACNFEPQRYELYSQFIECIHEINVMEKVWSSCRELDKMYEFAKSGSLKDILFYHVRILEHIEDKINSLEELQETNEKTLKYIQKGICESF